MTKIVPLASVTEADPNADLGPFRGGAISIGNFDGVHLGHAAMLRKLRSVADRIGGPAVAVALDPHPAAILRPDRVPAKLTTIERRAALMDSLGIDALVVCNTEGGLLKLSAEAFFHALVRQTLDAKAIVEGPNFFFGQNRGGDLATLQRLSDAEGIELHVADPTSIAGEMVSSTRIRHLLGSGDVEQANRLLGTPYRIGGRVVVGASRGRTIGFPTANLDAIDTMVPAAGVYGGLVRTMDEAETEYTAAIHIGPNPTFDDNSSTKVEVHLIDYDGDLYDQHLFVDFQLKVRDVIKFDSSDQLVEQLGHDVQTIRNHLASR